MEKKKFKTIDLKKLNDLRGGRDTNTLSLSGGTTRIIHSALALASYTETETTVDVELEIKL